MRAGESQRSGAVAEGLARCGVVRDGLAEFVYRVGGTAHRLEFATSQISEEGMAEVLATLERVMRRGDPPSDVPGLHLVK